ncbi:MAG: putative zinc-binding protein [Desulfotignum sp.]|nr:putative zinc-binding protein [Desulfobacteraceae bacterium]
MTKDCRCDQPDIMILSCSGGSYEGQLANRAAWELTGEGLGRMFCLAGIGANISGFVQSAKDVAQMVVIDGCETACARILLENTGIAVTEHMIVSRLNIGKTDGVHLDTDDVAAVKHAVRLACKRPVKKVFDSPSPLSPGDRARSRQLGGKCC